MNISTRVKGFFNNFFRSSNRNNKDLSKNIINAAWNKYKNSTETGDKRQDVVHNFLLMSLLDDDEFKNDSFYIQSIAALRKGIDRSLYQLRDQSGLNKLKSNEFFIRDFIQYYGPGGSSANYIKIGGQSPQTQLIINDLALIGIMQGSNEKGKRFSEKFDQYVKKVNSKLNSSGSSLPQVKFFVDIGHRDAIQLIPRQEDSNDDLISHFDGSVARYIKVEHVKINSPGKLQGIFASDGAFRDLHIINNDVKINGKHSITINGMLSGVIDQNNTHGKNINLYPLRIGGGANIFILSFVNSKNILETDVNYYKYWDIKDLSGNIVNNPRIKNFREKAFDSNYTYYKNVNVKEVYQKYEASRQDLSTLTVNRVLDKKEKEEQIYKYWVDLLESTNAERVYADE